MPTPTIDRSATESPPVPRPAVRRTGRGRIEIITDSSPRGVAAMWVSPAVRAAVIALALLHFLDVGTTLAALSAGIPESNPAMAAIIALAGPAGMAAEKIVVVALTVVLAAQLPRRWQAGGLWGAGLIVGTAVMRNLLILNQAA